MRPHLVALSWRAEAGPWLQMGGVLLTSAGITRWDPSVDVQLRRRLAVDVAGVQQDCQIPSTEALAAVVVWHCPATMLRGSGSRVELNHGHGAPTLEAEITSKCRVEHQRPNSDRCWPTPKGLKAFDPHSAGLFFGKTARISPSKGPDRGSRWNGWTLGRPAGWNSPPGGVSTGTPPTLISPPWTGIQLFKQRD